MHLAKIIAKCNCQHHCDKIAYYLDEHGIVYKKFLDRSNIFHTIIVLQKLQPYILYKSHNTLGHNGSTRLYNSIKRFYYSKKLYQNCDKYVRSSTECQQATLK